MFGSLEFSECYSYYELLKYRLYLGISFVYYFPDALDSQGFSTCMQSNAISLVNNNILGTCESVSTHTSFLRDAISVSGELIRRCHSARSLNLTLESVVNSLFETLTDSMTSMHSSASASSLYTVEIISKLVKPRNAEFVVLPQSVIDALHLSVRKLLLHLVRSTDTLNVSMTHVHSV